MVRLMMLGAVCTLALGCSKPDKTSPKAGVTTQNLNTGESKVVAKIGDAKISLADFERQLGAQSAFSRSRYGSTERKREFLDTLVRFELLANEAEAKGHGAHPDVVTVRKQAMVRQLMAKEVRALVKMSDIQPADIKGYYTDHKSEFDKPAQTRAAHILIADEKEALTLHAEVVAALEGKPLKAREIFAEFARSRSADVVTRAAGGDLRFFTLPGGAARPDDAPNVPDVVAIAAHALAKVGAVSPALVKSDAGWHLIQKTGFRRPFKRDLADVSTQIRNKLFRARKGKAMEKYVADLRAKATITIDDAVLSNAKLPAKSGNGVPRLRQPGLKFPGGKAHTPNLPRPTLPIPVLGKTP